jgi:hypothetical protein
MNPPTAPHFFEEPEPPLPQIEVIGANRNGNGSPSPFLPGEHQLLDELHLQHQLRFLNQEQLLLFDGTECRSPGVDSNFFPYGEREHRRSSSVSKPCLHYASAYCKNSSTCRFVRG